MLKKTENLAWLTLILSFVTCITLTLGSPLAVRWYLMNTTRDLDIVLQPRGGTVTQQTPGNNRPELMSLGEPFPLTNRSRVQLNANADALLLFYQHGVETPLLTTQLYGSTDVIVEKADTPRFTISHLPHRVVIRVQRGANIRFSVEGNGRATRVEIHTPHGVLETEEGTYAIFVDEEQTELAVRTGHARVPNPETGEIYVLTDLQRIEITADGLGQVSVAERNILSNRNGNFTAPLGSAWQVYTDTAFADQGTGSVRQIETGEEQAVIVFGREGEGWSETGITQEINQDIRGARSLYVRARVMVNSHSLGVCGSRGTECPIMLGIKYADQYGTSGREWIQGFYVNPGPDEAFCQVCEWKAEHQQVPRGVWYDYESEDLLPLMRAQEIEPSVIESVTVYASGHSYESRIEEIAIIVGE